MPVGSLKVLGCPRKLGSTGYKYDLHFKLGYILGL